MDHVISQVREEGIPLPGVVATLEMLHSQGVKKCIASSSFERIIAAVVDVLGIEKYFEFIYSAENETHGKPHPGVFITAAAKFGVSASSCVVFEDSPSGVLAAKAARMTCVAVPEAEMRDHRYIGIADRVLGSLEEFTQTYWHELIDR